MTDTGYGDFEFERRFLARNVPDHLLEATPTLIVQSYLLSSEGYAVRVRAQAPGVPAQIDPALDELATLERYVSQVDFGAVTVKGPMVAGTRYEAERELDPTVAIELIRRGGGRVAKLRHAVWLGEDGWVIDVFTGRNAPLVVAEVERGGPVTNLAIPDFAITEVTVDPRFANDSLAREPYSAWADEYAVELARTGPTFLAELGDNRRVES